MERNPLSCEFSCCLCLFVAGDVGFVPMVVGRRERRMYDLVAFVCNFSLCDGRASFVTYPISEYCQDRLPSGNWEEERTAGDLMFISLSSLKSIVAVIRDRCHTVSSCVARSHDRLDAKEGGTGDVMCSIPNAPTPDCEELGEDRLARDTHTVSNYAPHPSTNQRRK